MPAWWLGPDLTVATSSPLLRNAAHPVLGAVEIEHPPADALPLDLDPDLTLRLDGQPLARCATSAALTFFLESLLTHLATHGNRSCHVLHAGLVRWRGQTILLPGERGSGKSTTTLWLARRGGEYLGDDLCFIDPATLAARGLAKAATLKAGSFPLYPESPTFTDPLRGPVRYFLPPCVRTPGQPPLNIDRLVFPRYEPDTATHAEPIAPALAALALVQQSYGGGEWGRRGLDLAARLAARPAHLIRYRQLDEFEAALEGLPT